MAQPKDLQKEFVQIANARKELELEQALKQEQRDYESKQRNEKFTIEQFGKMGVNIDALLKTRQESTEQSAALLRKLEEQYELERSWEKLPVIKPLTPKTLVRGAQILRPFSSTFARMGGAVVRETDIRNGDCWWTVVKSDNGGGFRFFDAYWTFNFTPRATRNYALIPHVTFRGSCWMRSDNKTWELWSHDFAQAFIEVRTDVFTGYWRGEQVTNVYDKNFRNIDLIEPVVRDLHITRTDVLAARVPAMIRVAVRFAVNSGGSAYSVLKFGAPNHSYPICCPSLHTVPL